MDKSNLLILSLFLIAGCQGAKHEFLLNSASQSFQQSTQEIEQRKVDILWVVDNSGSMTPFQQNLVNNFDSFIQKFIEKGSDFHIAVTTTDAYLGGKYFKNDPTYSLLKDGVGNKHTGYPIIDIQTPNPTLTFTTNASQGGLGSGDERAFSSMREALENPANSRFLRRGSFLAIIILSDEDDFSNPSRPENMGDLSYNNPNLEPVDTYVNYLDQLTQTKDPTNRNYNLSAVAVKDTTCLTSHQIDAPSSIIGQRYIEIVNKTGGVLADICSPSYSVALQQIQKKILDLSTEFLLQRRPKAGTISIVVNGQLIKEDEVNGWTYDSNKNSIQFHGNGVPPKGAAISVDFAPDEPT